MKKILILPLLLIASSVVADDFILDRIGPATLANGTTSLVTINQPGTKFKNCLTSFDFQASSNVVINVLDGGTTIWTANVSTTAAPAVNLYSPLATRLWPIEEPLCAGNNATMYINIQNVPFRINYQGVIKGSR